MSYACPLCASTDLGTDCLVSCHVRRTSEGETYFDPVPDAEYTIESTTIMWCNDCGHTDGAYGFWRED